MVNESYQTKAGLCTVSLLCVAFAVWHSEHAKVAIRAFSFYVVAVIPQVTASRIASDESKNSLSVVFLMLHLCCELLTINPITLIIRKNPLIEIDLENDAQMCSCDVTRLIGLYS